MSSERPLRTPIAIDPALLAVHPDLAVLTLNLPDSDGEPMENEREYFQIVLLYEALEQYWRGRRDFYMGGNMFVYYSPEQAHEILAEEADPARPRRAFRGPDLFIVLDVDGSFRRQKWVVWDEGGRYPDVIFAFLSPRRRERSCMNRPSRPVSTTGMIPLTRAVGYGARHYSCGLDAGRARIAATRLPGCGSMIQRTD